MKKRILFPALCLCLCLTGCGAMLERSYEVSSPHVDKPATVEDSSILRVKDYRELVSAVLYLVAQGQETGAIQLVDYTGDVETDLTAACLEVATEDPLGAYCVDYIKHESIRVVSYDQATITIRYRRSAEQVASMVNVTGTSAIRAELQEALSQFRNEVVLRIAYFAGDADGILSLIRQAYYDAPLYAMGMPQVEIALYPDSGRERVVEILLTYPQKTEQLKARSEILAARAANLAVPWSGLSEATAAIQTVQALRTAAAYDPQGESTPYAALVGGAADDQGLALAYLLLCQEEGLTCEVVEGTRPAEGEDPDAPRESRFWNLLTLSGEKRCLDPSADEPRLFTVEELIQQGWDWPGAPVTETAEEAFGAEGEKNSPGNSQ